MSGCLPVSEFGQAWPEGVPVQVHGKEADPFFDEDLEAARALADSTDEAELFLYPGNEHLFADSSLPAYDAAAAALLTESRAGVPRRRVAVLGRSADQFTCAGGLHRSRERGDVVRAVVADAVDEERRRAGDAAQVGRVDVLGDPRARRRASRRSSSKRSTSSPSCSA